MPRFTELRVQSSPAVTRAGRVLEGFPFSADAYHVAALFMAALPRDYVLDGASLLTLQCGPHGDEPVYQCFPGASVVCVDPFDFAAHADSDPATRERAVLALIEQHGLALIDRVEADPAPWRAAAALVRAQGFQREDEVARLGRALPGRLDPGLPRAGGRRGRAVAGACAGPRRGGHRLPPDAQPGRAGPARLVQALGLGAGRVRGAPAPGGGGFHAGTAQRDGPGQQLDGSLNDFTCNCHADRV